MSSIAKYRVGNNTYLYETTSFRKDGKPRNKRKIIGKIDRASGDYIYKQDYIDRMKERGTPIEIKKSMFSSGDVKSSTIKEYGAFYFYQQIANKIGLLQILKDVFPENWEEVFTAACYLTSTGDPMMYCKSWVEKTECYSVDLSSQHISDLLQELSHKNCENFFRAWGKYRTEKEYLALDITSISSYSQQIETVEWGYNRDKEKRASYKSLYVIGGKLPFTCLSAFIQWEYQRCEHSGNITKNDLRHSKKEGYVSDGQGIL
jgi:hypothetical protein